MLLLSDHSVKLDNSSNTSFKGEMMYSSLFGGHSSSKIFVTIFGVAFLLTLIPHFVDKHDLYQFSKKAQILNHESLRIQLDHNYNHVHNPQRSLKSINEAKGTKWPILSYIKKRISSYFVQNTAVAVTKQVLDAFAQQQNLPEFDDELWGRMVTCMDKMSAASANLSLNLMDVSNQGWSKFIQYGQTGGSVNDPWGYKKNWLEWDPKPLKYNASEITIYEPCNAVSNLAFYRSMVAICQINDNAILNRGSWSILGLDYVSSLVRTFSLLAMGSAFFHASETKTGGQLDVIPIHTIALLGHQSTLQSIPYSRLLHDLIPVNDTKKQPINGIKATNKLNQIVLHESVYDWLAQFLTISNSIPDYYKSFAAFVVTLVDTILPESTAIKLIATLGDALLSDEDLNFILKEYEPALRQSLSSNFETIRATDKARLFPRSVGTGLKMLWAFYWQEEVIEGPHLTNPSKNVRASIITPLINRMCNSITGYHRYFIDPQFQLSVNVYPGDRQCNAKQPHSKWHEESANALVDLLLLMADLKNVLEGGSIQLSLDSNIVENFLQCSLEKCMSGFDAFDRINNINNDTAIVAFNDCLPLLRDLTLEDGDSSGFSNCLLSHYASNTASSSSSDFNNINKKAEIQYLENCLLQHDCVLFTSFWNVEVDLECFNEGPCNKFTNSANELQQCLNTCSGGFLCTSECFLKYGTDLSPSFKQMFSCLVVLSNPLRPDKEGFLNACQSILVTKSSSEVTAMNAILKGLPTYTRCATESPCKSSLSSFTAKAQDASSCASECFDNGPTKNPFPFISLPRGLSCWLDCILKQYALPEENS